MIFAIFSSLLIAEVFLKVKTAPSSKEEPEISTFLGVDTVLELMSNPTPYDDPILNDNAPASLILSIYEVPALSKIS